MRRQQEREQRRREQEEKRRIEEMDRRRKEEEERRRAEDEKRRNDREQVRYLSSVFYFHIFSEEAQYSGLLIFFVWGKTSVH